LGCGPEDEQDMTAPEGGSIAIEAVLNNAAVISISEASDSVTAAENLSYAIYYTQNQMSEDVNVILNETTPSGGWSTKTGPRMVAGLRANVTYNITALVKDENSNIAKLNTLQLMTGSLPSLPGSPSLDADVSGTSATITWDRSSSQSVESSALLYRVYLSESNNLISAEETIKNGMPVDVWKTNIDQLTASSLKNTTRYYYNVLVKDEFENTSAYSTNYFETETIVHIAYLDDSARQIKYVNYDTSTWSVPEVISGSDTSYRYDSPAMAVDDSGVPYVCYYSESNSALHMSSFDGTEFSVETVQDIDNAGQYCSIAMDSRNQPVMTAYDGTARDPVFYFLYDDMWSEQTISATTESEGLYTDLKIDKLGKYHVAYYNSSSRDLVYATNISGQWASEIVDSSGDVGLTPSLVVHADQSVSVAYFSSSNADLKFATNESGSWLVSTIDSDNTTGQYPSMKLGPDGLLNIAYFYSSGSQVRYIKESDSGWENFEVVDGFLNQMGNYGISLDVDRLNRVHISYYNASDKNLHYAYRDDPDNMWQTTAVDTSTNSVGKYSSIVVK
jgi:hypothetical protein